jgi:hypothetical protein
MLVRWGEEIYIQVYPPAQKLINDGLLLSAVLELAKDIARTGVAGEH